MTFAQRYYTRFLRAAHDSFARPRRKMCSKHQNPPQHNQHMHTNMGITSHNNAPLEEAIFTESPLIFDTHRMISFLKAGGFSQAQSETITDAMVRVSQHANRHHSRQMVTKNEFVSLRSELSILEKSDFALLKTDINAIEKRMETSVAEIYTAVERVENRVIKWVIAVAGAIGLAIIRLTTTSSSAPKVVEPPPPSNVNDGDLPKHITKKGFQILVT